MKIQYLGHSSFKLTGSTGASVVTDPYAPEVGYKMPKVTADAVTVSHHHFDHDYTEGVGGNPQIIDKEGSYRLHGVEINAVKSFHDNVHGKKRGENVIFKFRMDGIDICHLGDLGEACSAELTELIQPVDVLLIPVGGNYTIDAATAKEYVKKLMPKVVIPMHYRSEGCKIDIEKVNKFIDLFDAEQVEEAEASEIELSRGDLTGETRVIVLRRA